MADRLRTPLCDMLGIEYPIIQAGMSTGEGIQSRAPASIRLTAAVSNAGGLGVLGYGFHTPAEFDEGIREVRRLTDRPFGADFMIPASLAEVGAQTSRQVYAQVQRDYPRHVAFVQELIREYNLSPVEIPDKPVMSEATLRRQLEVVLDNKVAVFAAAAGEPPPWFAEQAHAMGMKLIGMCGSVRHVRRQIAANVDIITAQGTEAGGHTGNIANFPLVPQVVDAARPRPVVVAGGVGSGRQVAAALALGAAGVWCGTAFLTSEETNLPAQYQEEILTSASEDYTLSKYGSGKQMRSHRNAVKEAWEKSGLPALPMPLQGIVMEPFNLAARQVGREDLLSHAAGQVAGMLTKRRPARDILLDMVQEAEETIGRLQAFTR
ncbi:MAG: nitronate monooxygenase [Chloroflexi bacterium]|nr:nitronate monooxygenase [Chloroflexota bacterium]